MLRRNQKRLSQEYQVNQSLDVPEIALRTFESFRERLKALVYNFNSPVELFKNRLQFPHFQRLLRFSLASKKHACSKMVLILL